MKCLLTKKTTISGNKISHSKRKTKRKFRTNFQKKTITILGKKIKLILSVKGFRTIKKIIK